MRSHQAHEGLVIAGREGVRGEVPVQQGAFLLEVLVGYRQLDDGDPGKHLRGAAFLDDGLLKNLVAGRDHVVVVGECLLASDGTASDPGPEPGKTRQTRAQGGDGLLPVGRGTLPDRQRVGRRCEGRDRVIGDGLLALQRSLGGRRGPRTVDDHLGALVGEGLLQASHGRREVVHHHLGPDQREGAAGRCGDRIGE